MLTATVRGLQEPIQAMRLAVDVLKARRPLLALAGTTYVTEVVPETFATNGGAIGENWDQTVDGRAALKVSGALKDTISWQIAGDRVLIGSPLVYGITHQQTDAHRTFDGVIRAKNFPYLRFAAGGSWAMKKEVKIPRRTFLKFTPAILQRIGDRWRETLTAILHGHGR